MISFTVYGKPEAQGSTRAFIPKGWTRPVITSASKKQKPWRQQISRAALDAMIEARQKRLFDREVAIAVKLAFFFRKPKHTPKKTTFKTTKPDCDKLARCVLDSLSGTVFVDDSQVVDAQIQKFFGDPERVEITVVPLYGVSEVE